MPVIGTSLCEAVATMEISTGGETSWGIELRFAKNQRFRLSYRPELDGSIELDEPDHHFNIDRIVIDGPEQDFGWLHPTRLDFILDDQHWRSANVADWPFPLRKMLQSCTEPEVFYRQTMRRALLAHYRQNPFALQRLLALRYPVRCKDLPDGLIEEVAVELRAP